MTITRSFLQGAILLALFGVAASAADELQAAPDAKQAAPDAKPAALDAKPTPADAKKAAVEEEKQRLAEAEAAFKQIIEATTKLVQLFPREASYQNELARCYAGLASVQFRGGHPQEGEASYKRSIEQLEKLAVDNPKVIDYRVNLIQSYSWLGAEQVRTGRANEGKEIYQRAVAAQEKLIRDFPAAKDQEELLATLHLYAGIAARTAGALNEAELIQQQTIELLRKLAATKPALRSSLAFAFVAYGDTLAMSDRWQDAADAYSSAVTIDNRVRVYCTRRAVLLLAAGDTQGYQAACADLIERFGKTDNPVDAMYIAETCVLGERALADMAPVIALAQRAVAANPASPIAKTVLGAAELRNGQTEQAITTLKAASPQFAAGAFLPPPQRDLLRLSRLLAEMSLAVAFQKQGNREDVDSQVKTIRKVIEKLGEAAPPANDSPFAPWSISVAVTIANRQLAELAGDKVEQK